MITGASPGIHSAQIWDITGFLATEGATRIIVAPWILAIRRVRTISSVDLTLGVSPHGLGEQKPDGRRVDVLVDRVASIGVCKPGVNG